MLPPPQRALFFFAHPDDELAVAVRLRRWHRQGVEITCAWAHQTAIREQESRRTMLQIGVTHLHFGNSPDGDFVDYLPRLQSWVESVCHQVQPDWIAVTAFEQGHLDHDSLNWACRSLDAPTFEYPMYHHYARVIQNIHRFSTHLPVDELQLTPEESAWKRGLLMNYPSQSVARNVRWAERLGKLAGQPNDLFLTERLRSLPMHDYLLPAHPDSIRRRVERSREWKRWSRAMRQQVG